MQNHRYRGLSGTQFDKFLEKADTVRICEYVDELKGVIPVRIFWKASSTLLASRAEVSMKDRLFSPAITKISITSLS